MKNHAWIKDFFAEENKILILPFESGEAYENHTLTENCTKFFQLMGLPSFQVKSSITIGDDSPSPCHLIFASDFFKLYEPACLMELLKELLPYTAGETSFLRWKSKEHNLLRGANNRFVTSILKKTDTKYKITQIEKSPSASKKVKVILDVLNRSPGIKLEAEPPFEPFNLTSANPPTLDIWRGLYWNAEAFLHSFLQNGSIPNELPKAKRNEHAGIEIVDKENLHCLLVINSHNIELKESCHQILLDAGLYSCGSSEDKREIFAYIGNERKSEEFYWLLLCKLYQNLDLEYVALSRGNTERSAGWNLHYKEDPLPGLNGELRLQVIQNTLHDNHINFNEFLELVDRNIRVRKKSEKEDLPIMHELFNEEKFLISFLQFKINDGQVFPDKDLAILCIDSPSIQAKNEDGIFQLFFPHYFNNQAISKEDYINLMMMLSMLLNQKSLLIQSSSGALFRINTDTESEALGEVELLENSPIHDSLWWKKILETISCTEWKFFSGSIKGEKIPFIPASFFNRSYAHNRMYARESLLSGAKKLKAHYKLSGSCKNTFLHEKSARNYLFYKDLLINNSKKISQSFFNNETPSLYVDVSALEEDAKKQLAVKFTEKGCLVCLIDEMRGLIAKPLFPPQDFKNYWKWLKEQSKGFVGISLGRPWYILSNPKIDDIFWPLGWHGLYVS